MFHKDEDYAAFDRVLAEAHQRIPIRILAILSDWPVDRPADWKEFVNEPHSAEALGALRRSANRGCPFGDDDWQRAMVQELGLEWTVRPRGRPKKTAVEQAI